MLTKIPDGLSLDAAAPILCAGVTVYKALKQSGAKIGQWVVIRECGSGERGREKGVRDERRGEKERDVDWVWVFLFFCCFWCGCLAGCGGGLGHLAIQYAAAAGFRTIGIDVSVDNFDLFPRLVLG